MEIYIVSFIICEILAYIAARLTKNKYVPYILQILIILILSVIGGCRDFNIGTDVYVYGKTWFERAFEYSNLVEYINSFNNTDYGYLVLNFFVSRFTHDVNIFLFVLQLISNTLIVTTLFKYRKKVPFWLSLLSFLCIYYLRTYNYMRQSLALGIIFFCIRYIDNKKVIKFLIGIGIATLFHSTAIIGIVLYPISYFVRKNNKIFNYFIVLGVILLILITFNIVDFIKFLYKFGIIDDKIYNYTDQYLNTTLNFNMVETLFRLFFIILVIISYKKINNKNSINKFLFICLVVDIILYQFSIFMSFANRISMYFGYMSILLIPQISDTMYKNYKDRVYMKIIISIILVIYCYYKFIHLGSCEVYPYTSTILNINYM